MTTFTDMNEVIEYVEMAAGDFVEDFDIEAIASEIVEWVDGKLALTEEAEDGFWAIMEEHAISSRPTAITNIILTQYKNAKEDGYVQFITMDWDEIKAIMRTEAAYMSGDRLEAAKTLYDSASEDVQHHVYESEWPEVELASMLMSHWRSAIRDELYSRTPAPNASEIFPWLA